MRIASLLGLAGRAGAGKDTVAGLLHDCIWGENGGAGIVCTSFAGPLKAGVESMFGIPAAGLTREEKEAPVPWLGKSPRYIYQTLGTEWARSLLGEDVWVRCMERRILTRGGPREHWIITDVRFPNEVAFIRRQGGAVWWVERDGVPEVRAHASEGALGPQDCDRTIANLGSVADLGGTVERAWSQWRAERAVA